MALTWADKNFRYGEDENNKQYQRNAEQSRAVLRESLLMAMCIRDMMQGNSKLADIGRVEESLGYNAIAARFANRHTGSVEKYTEGRKIVHIDIEPTQIGRVLCPDLGIVSDAKAALTLLVEVAQEMQKAGHIKENSSPYSYCWSHPQEFLPPD